MWEPWGFIVMTHVPSTSFGLSFLFQFYNLSRAKRLMKLKKKVQIEFIIFK